MFCLSERVGGLAVDFSTAIALDAIQIGSL